MLGRAPVDPVEEALFTDSGHTGARVTQNPRVTDDVIERLSWSEKSEHRWRAYYTERRHEEQRTRLATDPDPDGISTQSG